MTTSKKVPGYVVWCVGPRGYAARAFRNAKLAHRTFCVCKDKGMACALYLDGELAMSQRWSHDEINATARDKHYSMLGVK